MNNYQLPPASLLKSYQPDYVFLPNANFVSAHSVFSSDEFQNEQSMDLPIAAGRSFDGKLILFDLAKSPHLFIGALISSYMLVWVSAWSLFLLHYC